MIEKTVRFISPARHTLDVDMASDEPSHIHVARPSRRLRRDDEGTSVEQTSDELREIDPAAVQVTVQAA